MIAILKGGRMVKVQEPRNPNNANFVIVCGRGDWSGFLTYAECERRFPGLEKLGRPDGYFYVEER